MKKIVQQSKIHYYILLLILLCPCLHATSSKKGARSTKQQKSQTQQAVHIAASNGDINFFTKLSEKDGIKKILNTKDTSHHNWTPLHHATANNQAAIVRFILAQPNIQVNATTKDKGSTALHILMQNKHFDLLDYFIAYKEKQKEQQQQFTRLFLNKKDTSDKTPFDYFPNEENEELTQYKLKWDKLMGKHKQPKKPKPTPQQKLLNPKQKDNQVSTSKPPLPPNISMEPLSPTTSDNGSTSSPSSVTNAKIEHNTAQNQKMGISKTVTIQQSPTQISHSQATQPIITQTIGMTPLSPKPASTVNTSSSSSVANDHTPVPDQMIATIQQPHKQSSHRQTAQPITTKTEQKASTSEKSQQHSSAYHPSQQLTKASTTALQAAKVTTTKEVNLFYYLQCVVGVLLLGSIFYLIATQLNRKAF